MWEKQTPHKKSSFHLNSPKSLKNPLEQTPKALKPNNLENSTPAGYVFLKTSSMLCLGLLFLAQNALALPTDWQVEAGSATIYSPNAQTLNISTNSNQAVINFNSFNIGENETVNFFMPSTTATILNRVIGSGPSIISGAVTANGNLMLVNPNGIQLGLKSDISANNLVISTLNINTQDFLNRDYIFVRKDTDPYSQILNQGSIQANNVALISNAISNTGTIIATLGSVQLASGNKATMSFDPQGLIAVEVNEKTLKAVTGVDGKEVKDAIANTGTIQGARVVINAQVAEDIFESAVNLQGIVRADQVSEINGVIKITGDGADVKVDATVLAGQEGTIEIATDKNLEVQGEFEAPQGQIDFEAKGDIQVVGPITTKGDTTFRADNNIEVHADITTDSGDLNLIADADKNGKGSFIQDAGTTIKTVNSGDIHISSSQAAKLANIEATGELYLEASINPALPPIAMPIVTFTYQPLSTVVAHGDFIIGSQVAVNAAQTDFNVYGSWINNGTFNGQSSTVDFKGNQEIQITGTNSFNNLKILVPGKVVDFQGGETQNILGILQLNGGWGAPITLRSTSPPVPWKIFAHGSTDIQYVDVSNADNINILGPPLSPLHSRNSLGSTGWDFSLAGPSWQPDSQSTNNFWSNPHNWDSGLVPGVGDIVKIGDSALFLDSHDMVENRALSPILIDPAFFGTIGGLVLESGFNGTVSLERDLNVTGDVVLNGGVLAGGKGKDVPTFLTVGGNWIVDGGTFDPGTSSVSFNDATQTSTITGNNTFYNLSITTPDKELRIEAGHTLTVINKATIVGALDEMVNGHSNERMVKLYSTVEGQAWTVDFQGTAILDLIRVRDAVSPYRTTVIPIGVNDGHNTGFDIDPVWDGGDADDDNWSSGDNWVGDVAPALTDAVTFDGDVSNDSVIIDNVGTWSGGTFTIQDAYSGTITQNVPISTANFSQASGTFTGGGGTITVTGTFTVSGGTFNASTSTVNISGALTLTGGTISGSSGVITAASYAVESGTISAILAGAVTLTKTTAGTVTLSGANTYTGATDVQAGVLAISNATALGTTAGATTVQSGAALQISGAITVGENLTLNGTGIASGGALINTLNFNSITGTITLGSSTRINLTSGILTLSGGITGTGFGLTTGGNGTTLQISTLGINTSTGGTLTKDGSHTLFIQASGDYTGATDVQAGTLVFSNATALGTSAGTTTVQSGAELRVTSTNLTVAENLILNGTGIASSGALSNTGTNSITGTITLGSSTRINSSATLTLSNAAGITGTGFALTVGGTGNTAITGGIKTSTAATLTKDGTGTLTISGAGDYTGATTISAGVVNIQNATALGTTAGATSLTSGAVLEIQGGISVGAETLTLDGTGISSAGALRNVSGDNSWAGDISLTAATRINSNSGTLTLSGTNLSGTAANLTVGGSGHVGIGSIIANTTGTLTKDGTGTLTLSGSNTYTGLTTLSAGTLAVTSNNALGTNAAGTTITIGTTLDFQNVTYSTTEALTVIGGGTLATSTGTSSFAGNILMSAGECTVNVSGTQLTLSGVISDTGEIGITKSGSGILILSGDNTYTGITTISAGTIKLGSPGDGDGNTPLGTVDEGTTVSSGAVLDLNGFSLDSNEALSLSGTGIASGGALTNSSASSVSYIGLITLASASSIIASSGDINISNAGTITGATFGLTLGGAGNGTLTSILGTTSGTLTKSGAGTWTISGINTYTGTTTISAGTLKLGNAGVIANTSAVTVTGTLDMNANSETIGSLAGAGTVTSSSAGAITLTAGGDNTSTTFSGVIQDGSGTVSLTKAGSGSLIVSGTNTYTGATTVSAGVLNVQNAQGTGTTAGGVSVTSGAALQIQGGITVGAEALTLNGTGVSSDGALRNISGDNSWSGDITLGLATRINSDSGTLTLSGGVSGATFGLTLGGAGNTALSGIIGITSGTLTKDGAGTTTLSGANTYTGATTVSAGVLNIQHATATGTTAGGVSVTSGAALQIQGGISVGAEALTLNGTGVSSDGALRNISGTNSWSGTITLGSATRINSDAGTLTLSGSIGGAGQNLTVGGAGNTTISGGIGTSTGTLTKDGSGTLVLSGSNTYLGGTTISAGILNLQGSSSFVGSYSVTSGAALEFQATFLISAGATITLNGSGIASGGALRNISGSTSLGSSIVLASDARINSDSGTLTLSNVSGITGTGFALTLGGASSITISGGINTSTGGTIIKDGSGTLSLQAAGNYTGNTTISAGVVSLGVSTGLGTSAGGTTVASGAALNLTGSAMTVAEPITLNGTGISSAGALRNTISSNTVSGAIILGSATRINSDSGILTLTGGITATANGTSLTIGGNGSVTISTNGINTSTNGSLTYEGTTSNALTISAAGNYTGATLISSGTVAISNALALGTSGSGTTVTSGAVLRLSGTIDVIGEALSLAGSGSVTGALVSTSGTNSWTGAISLTAATTISADAGTLTLSGGISGTATSLTIGAISGGAGDVTINSIIAITSGSLTKGGTGTTILSGANTYTGTTTVSTGVLNIQHATALGTTASGTTVSSGAALQIQGNIAVGAELLIIQGTGISTTGAFRNISGDNSWAGSINVTSSSRVNSDAGTLTLSGGFLSSGNSLTIGGSGNSLINSIIGISGGTLTKDGAGTLTLSAANTYTGSTTVSAGVLNIQHATATGTIAGGVSVTSGAALQIQGGIIVGAEALTLNGTGISSDGALRSISGDNTWGGAITLGLATRINSDANTLTLSGGVANAGFTLSAGGAGDFTVSTTAISGTGALTYDGSGTLNLNIANSYTGLTTVSSGTVKEGVNNALSSGNLTVSGGTFNYQTFTDTVGTVSLTSGTITSSTGILTSNADYDVQSGTISGILAGSVGLTKTTAGTVTISSANTYTGTTTVSAGTLAVTGNNALGTTAAGTTVASGATLDFQGVTYATTEGVTLNGGTLATSTGTSTFAGAITLGADSTVNVGGTQLTVSGGISGAFALNKTGVGILRAGVAFSPAGAFTISAGTYDANGNTTTVTGLTTISGGTYSASTATQTFNGGLTVSGGTFTGSSGAVDVNGNLVFSSGAFTAPSNTLSVSGDMAITDTDFTHNSGTVTLDGTSTQTVSANNITFYNLTKTDSTNDSSSRTLTLTSGETINIAGLLTLDGLDANDMLLLRATAASAATINFAGSSTFSGDYLDIQYSTVTDNSSGVSLPIFPVNSINSGNNIGWFFAATTPGITTWVGSNSSDWNDALNWDSGIVPDATTTVVIATTLTQPILTGSTQVGSVTISSGNTLTTNGNLLTVNGNLMIAGTLAVSSSTITVSGNVTAPGGSITGNNPTLVVQGSVGTLDQPVLIDTTTINIQASGGGGPLSISARGAKDSFYFNEPMGGFIFLNGNLQKSIGQQNIRGLLNQADSGMFVPPPLPIPFIGGAMFSPMMAGAPTLIGIAPRITAPVARGTSMVPAIRMPTPALTAVIVNPEVKQMIPSRRTVQTETKELNVLSEAGSNFKGVRAIVVLNTVVSSQDVLYVTGNHQLSAVGISEIFSGSKIDSYLPQPLFEGARLEARMSIAE